MKTDSWKISKAGSSVSGPKQTVYPSVFQANAFIGNYLRKDILSRYGLKDAGSSCNHGFDSYIGHVLYRNVLGVRQIDYVAKEVTIRFSDMDLDECSGVIPVDLNRTYSFLLRMKGKDFGFVGKNIDNLIFFIPGKCSDTRYYLGTRSTLKSWQTVLVKH